MTHTSKRLLVLLTVIVVGTAAGLAVVLTHGNEARAVGLTPATAMAGLQRQSTQLSTTPAVLAAFPGDMAPQPGAAHILASHGDVSVYAWQQGTDSVCVAHSGGGGGCFETFYVPINATISDPDRLGAGHPLYVWGVTTNAVTSVEVVVSGVAHSVPVSNNAFVYVLSDNTLGPEAVDGMVAHFADGTTQSLPAP